MKWQKDCKKCNTIAFYEPNFEVYICDCNREDVTQKQLFKEGEELVVPLEDLNIALPHGEKKQPRKIIQISTTVAHVEGVSDTIYALCNDGTLWNFFEDSYEGWNPMPPIPQGSACRHQERTIDSNNEISICVDCGHEMELER